MNEFFWKNKTKPLLSILKNVNSTNQIPDLPVWSFFASPFLMVWNRQSWYQFQFLAQDLLLMTKQMTLVFLNNNNTSGLSSLFYDEKTENHHRPNSDAIRRGGSPHPSVWFKTTEKTTVLARSSYYVSVVGARLSTKKNSENNRIAKKLLRMFPPCWLRWFYQTFHSILTRYLSSGEQWILLLGLVRLDLIFWEEKLALLIQAFEQFRYSLKENNRIGQEKKGKTGSEKNRQDFFFLPTYFRYTQKFLSSESPIDRVFSWPKNYLVYRQQHEVVAKKPIAFLSVDKTWPLYQFWHHRLPKLNPFSKEAEAGTVVNQRWNPEAQDDPTYSKKSFRCAGQVHRDWQNLFHYSYRNFYHMYRQERAWEFRWAIWLRTDRIPLPITIEEKKIANPPDPSSSNNDVMDTTYFAFARFSEIKKNFEIKRKQFHEKFSNYAKKNPMSVWKCQFDQFCPLKKNKNSWSRYLLAKSFFIIHRQPFFLDRPTENVKDRCCAKKNRRSQLNFPWKSVFKDKVCLDGIIRYPTLASIIPKKKQCTNPSKRKKNRWKNFFCALLFPDFAWDAMWLFFLSLENPYRNRLEQRDWFLHLLLQRNTEPRFERRDSIRRGDHYHRPAPAAAALELQLQLLRERRKTTEEIDSHEKTKSKEERSGFSSMNSSQMTSFWLLLYTELEKKKNSRFCSLSFSNRWWQPNSWKKKTSLLFLDNKNWIRTKQRTRSMTLQGSGRDLPNSRPQDPGCMGRKPPGLPRALWDGKNEGIGIRLGVFLCGIFF